MSKQRILVVDDEDSLCEILKFNLEIEGFDADVAHSAEQALQLDLSIYNLILLDVMMGEISGFKMAQIMRSDHKTANTPIIFCTAKNSEDDTVAGLTIGGDDYITKPFSVREVIARVKSVIRRTAQNTATKNNAENITYKELALNITTKTCTLNGEEVYLTKTEFELLKLFLSKPEKVFSRAEILSAVWSDEVIVLDRTIDVNITRLRKKIGKYGKNIATRLGYGYGWKNLE